jgi:hypothetical protein
MGSLPDARVSVPPYPFYETGVDYFGPMEVTIGGRHEKDGVSCSLASRPVLSTWNWRRHSPRTLPSWPSTG